MSLFDRWLSWPAALVVLGMLCTDFGPRAAFARFPDYPALMDTLVAGDFQAAERICDSLEGRFGANSIALYARLSVIYARITDYEDSSGRGELLELANRCQQQVAIELAEPGADKASLHYLAGSCLSTKALLLKREGRTVAALRLLMKSRDEFARAIDADPEFYDSYLGRGAYRYGVATHASLLGFLPFMPSAASGWSDLWLAVQRSDFSRWPALTAIVWFALDDQNYGLADSICTAGLDRFPGCRGFLWPKLSLLVRQSSWVEAEAVALELNRQYAELGVNTYDQIGLCLQLSKICEKLSRPDEAREWAKRGLLIPRTADISERRREPIRELAERAAKSP